MEHATVQFAGLYNTGAWMAHTRGIHPSRCTMRVRPQVGLKDKVDDLVFKHGQTTFTFTDCAVREVVPINQDSRTGHRYDIVIEDRRWKWRYPEVNGIVNERMPNGAIRNYSDSGSGGGAFGPGGSPAKGGVSIMTDRDMATFLFTALGDPNADVSALPGSTYPYAVWHGARASLELEWLLSRFGLTVALQLDDTVKVVPLHDDAGAALPTTNILGPVELHDWKPATIPSKLRIRGGPTVYQSKLRLKPLRFEPYATWTYDHNNWPEWMSDVPQVNRTEAFMSGARYWYVDSGWTAATTIYDFRQLELLDHLAEMHFSRPSLNTEEWFTVRPVIKGDGYWKYDEIGGSAADEVWTGGWSYLPDHKVIVTDRPVFFPNQPLTVEPELYLYAAYRVRTPDGSGYVSEEYDQAVGGAPTSTRPRVLSIPELARVDIEASPWGITGQGSLPSTEASNYLTELVKQYTYAKASAFWYSSFQDIDLDGAISQAVWICGDFGTGQTAYTLLGRHTEPNVAVTPTSIHRSLHMLAREVRQ